MQRSRQIPYPQPAFPPPWLSTLAARRRDACLVAGLVATWLAAAIRKVATGSVPSLLTMSAAVKPPSASPVRERRWSVAEVAGPGADLRWFRLPDIQGNLWRTGQPDQETAGPDRHGHASRWRTVASGIVGLIIVIAGLTLVFEGIRAKFMKYLQQSQMSLRMRRLVKWLGVLSWEPFGPVGQSVLSTMMAL